MSDVLVRYTTKYTTRTPVRGRSTKRHYGYRVPGETFDADPEDVYIDARLVPVNDEDAKLVEELPKLEAPQLAEVQPVETLPSPELDERSVDVAAVDSIDGIGVKRAEALGLKGVSTVSDFLEADQDFIQEVLSITPSVYEGLKDAAESVSLDTD